MKVDKLKFDDLLNKLVKAKPLPEKSKGCEETQPQAHNPAQPSEELIHFWISSQVCHGIGMVPHIRAMVFMKMSTSLRLLKR